MKTSMFKRVVSIVLAVVMVFLMLPVVEIETNAAVEIVIPIDDYSDLSFIGRGFNLLGDQYLRFDTLNKYSIFDPNVDAVSLDKIYADGLQSARHEGSFTYITDMSKYMRETQHSVGVGLEMEAKFKMVTLGFKTKYGITGSNKTEGSSKTEYAILNFQSIREVRSVRLDSRTYIERLYEYNMLNEDFVRELTEMTPEDLFKTYGTHIITGYASGGEMYITYEGQNMSSTVTDASSWKSETSISYGVEALGKISANIEAEQKQSGVDGSENSIVTAHTYVTGGSKTGVSPSDILTQKVSPDAWLDSVSDVQDILVNDNLQMIPIWELIIDDQHAAKKAELENYFNQHIRAEYAQLYSDYIYAPAADEGCYEDYTFVTSAEQLNAIRDDLDGHYVLCCDLDLQGAEWTPIGTSEAPFNGTFDGNGCTISGLSVTKCTDGAAGLFGYVDNGAQISNLRVAGKVDVDATGNANNLAYIGGIVGHNEGTVDNCYNMVTVNGKIAVTEDNDQTSAEEKHLDWDYDTILAKLKEGNTYDLSKDEDVTALNALNLNNETAIKLTGKATKAVNLKLTSGTVPLYIILENAQFSGNSADGTIFAASNCTRPVWIIVQGSDNSISNSNSGPAINTSAAELTIVGDGDFTITGGNGKDADGYLNDGKTGNEGGEGFYGIVASSMRVDMKARLTIVGGNGGKGANGKAGATGSSAAMNESSRLTAGKGTDGGDGGKGGQGALPTNVTSISVYSGTIWLRGGNGGPGGNGGTGGTGGEGKGTSMYKRYAANGGDGGKGGNGGDGGEPGLITDISYRVMNDAQIFAMNTAVYGIGGNGGTGGQGGNGGHGTNYDSAADSKGLAINSDGWPGEAYRAGMNGGNAGSGGQGGKAGSGYKMGSVGVGGQPGTPGAKGWYEVYVFLGENYMSQKHCKAGNPGTKGSNGNQGSILVVDIEKFAVKCRTANKEYVVYNKSTTYTNVADKGLISIGSEAEQKLIEQLIAIGSKSSYWIGLSWNTEKSRWVWADGNEVYVPNGADCDASDGKYIYGTCYDEFDEAVYDNWNVGQPDNYAPGEDAGMIYGLKDAFGKWNDAPSTSTRDGYITECDIGDRANYKPNGDKNICYAGGIVGFNAPAGKISNCINGANITIDRAYSQNGSIAAAAGGIAGGDVGESGNTALTIWKCYNKGTITAIAKSDAMNGWAFAAAYEICWQLDNTSVVADHVFAGNVCFPTAKSVNDLDKTLQFGNDLNTDTTPVSKTLQYWEHSRLSICFTGDVNEDEQDSDPSGYRNNLQYVVNNTFNEAFFTVNFDGKPVENYVVRYNFLTSGAKLVKITYNNGEYVRTIPVDVAEASPIALTVDENSNHQSTFIQNEIFRANGLVVNLMYNNGSSMTLTAANPEVSVEAPDMSTTGEKLVKVSYAGFTVEYPITVETEGIDLTNAPKIVVSSVSGSAGSTVTVDVVLENNPGISAAVLKIDYDETRLRLEDAVIAEAVSKDAWVSYNLPYITFLRNNNYTQDGIFLTLIFTVLQDAEVGKAYVTMDYTEDDVTNIDEESVKMALTSGNVIVINHIPGDINGDGKVNSKDLTRLLKYISHEKVEVVEEALDVNGDGVVTPKDLTRLLKYISHEDVEIY